MKSDAGGCRQDFWFAVQEGDRETLALLNEGLALVMALYCIPLQKFSDLHVKNYSAFP